MSSHINIIQLKKQLGSDLQSSHLILEFSGKTANTTLVNTLRRLVLEEIPMYAFHGEFFEISKNTSRYDNDEIRARLSQLTPANIVNHVSYLGEEYWHEEYIDYRDPKRNKHPKDKKIIEMYVNAINDTNEMMAVTTNHATFYENGEKNSKISGFTNKNPALIVKLKPTEVLKFRALAVLGIGKRSSIWSGGHAFYDENKGKIRFTIKSSGQMDEYELLYKACIIMKTRLNAVKKIIKNKYKKAVKDNIIKIKLEGYGHTVGNILTEHIQDRKDIQFAGYANLDRLENEIVITMRTHKGNPLDAFFETIDHVVKIFDTVQKKITVLGKKYISFIN